MSVMAAVVPHYIIGMALGAGVFGMFMLMEGFFAQPDDIPLYWRWAYYVRRCAGGVAAGTQRGHMRSWLGCRWCVACANLW